jgi:hypothetical protein
MQDCKMEPSRVFTGGLWSLGWGRSFCFWWALITRCKYTKSFDLILESCDTCPATPSNANYHYPNDNEYVDNIHCCPTWHEGRGPHNCILQQECNISCQLPCHKENGLFQSYLEPISLLLANKSKWQILKGTVLRV